MAACCAHRGAAQPAMASVCSSFRRWYGIQFINRKQDRYAFGIACAEHGIEHRLTTVNHPWTNGPVERMNRTIEEATVKRHYYGSPEQRCAHLSDFVAACNFARRLKTLRGLTPYEYVAKCWTEEPDRFKTNPRHHMPGPNS